MAKKLKSEKQKEIDKKGADRMKRYEDKQERKIKPVISTIEDDGLTCQFYWQKRGDGEWEECKYYYKKKEKN
jgi:hypothetical protein